MAEDVGSLVVKVAMEDSSFQQGVQNLNRNLKVIQSEFKSATAGLADHGKGIEGLKAKADMLNKSLEAQAKIVEAYQSKLKESQSTLESNAKKQIELANAVTKAEKAYKDSETALGKNAEETQKLATEYEKLLNEYSSGEEKIRNNQRAIDNWSIKTNNAKAKLSEMQSEFKATNESIKNHNSIWNESANSLQTWGSKAKSVGDNIKNVGQSINNHVSLPLFGVAAAAVKVGADFEAQMSRVQAISGATGEDFTKLNDQALQLGADTSFSAKQAAEGMENLASAGFSTQEIMAAMPGMLDLAASSGEDLATSADIAASTLRGFGLAADQAGHVADVLAKNAADTNAAVGDTGEAMKYIAPVAHAMGLSFEEVTAAIGDMANAGIKGSQAGTTLRSALTSLASPSKEAADAMKSMGFTAFDTQGKMLPLNEIISRLQKSTKNMTDEQKQNTIATIFGQEAMSGMLTLIQAGPEQLNQLTNSFKNSDGAAKQMAATMQNNLKGSIEQLKGSLETAAIKLEQNLAPSLKAVTDNLTGVVNKFGEASPATQKLTLTLGAVGIAAGPAIISVGNLVKAIGTISEVTGLSMAALGPWGIGIAAAGTAVLGLANYLKSDCIPSVDLFASKILDANGKIEKSFNEMSTKTKVSTNDLNNKVKASAVNNETELLKISDSTKKAITAYMDLDKKAGTALLSLKANNTKVTQAIATDMNKNIDNMSKQVVSGLAKRSTEAQNTLTTFFKNAKNITAKEQVDILKKSQTGYSNQEKSAEDAKNKIEAIYQNAANNHRQITDDEFKQIQQLQEQMRQQAVNTFTQSELEQQAIFEGIKNNATRLSTEQASEVIKNSASQRDKTIAAATEQAQKVEAEAIYQRDVTHQLTKDQADKIINEAERQKKDSITKANEMHTQVVNEVSQQCDGVKNTIDTKSGEIKSTWQSLCDWFESHIIHPKVEMSTSLADNSQGVYQKPTGYATGTTDATRGWHMVGENGPELLWFDGGETVLNNKDTAALFDKISSKINYATAKAWGTDFMQGLMDGINNNIDKVHSAAIATADSIYKVLHFSVPDEGPLSNADTYGSDFMQLLADTMNQSSDKPEAAAKKVADLIAQQIKSVKDKLASETKELNNQLSNLSTQESVDLRGAKGDSRYSIQDEYTAKKKAIKDEIDLRKDQANKEIAEIQKIGKMSKEQIQDELDTKKKAVEAINKLNDALEKAIERKLNAEKQAATESAKLKAKEEKLTKDQLSNLLEYVNTYYEKKLDKDAIEAQAEQLIQSKNQYAIIKILNKYGNLYEDSGLTLGERLTKGVKSWTDLVPGIVGNAMGAVQTEVKTAAVKVEDTLSTIMEGITSVLQAGAELSGVSVGSNNSSDDNVDLFSQWKNAGMSGSDEDPAQKIADKYKKVFDDIDLANIKLGKDTYSTTEELKKQQDTIDLQNKKLQEMQKEYNEIVAAVGETDDSAIQLRNDIASLSIEIENNTKKLQQDTITNKYQKYYDETDEAIEKLNKATGTFSEQLENQRQIYLQNYMKMLSMKQEYKELSDVLDEDSDAAVQLKKDMKDLQDQLDETSSKIKEDTIAGIDELTSKIKEALKTKYEEQEKLEEEAINTQLTNLEKWKTESEKNINTVYDAKIKALEAETQAEDRAATDTTELKNIANLQESIDYEHNEYNKQQLQKQLDKAKADRTKRLHEQEIADQKAALEVEKQNQLNNISAIYEASKTDLEKKLSDLKDFYTKKLDSTKLEAEAEWIVMNDSQKDIVNLLKSYSTEYENAGKTLGQKLCDGFQEKIKGITDMITSITAQINAAKDDAVAAAQSKIMSGSETYTAPSYLMDTARHVTNNNTQTVTRSVVNNNNINFNSPKALSPSEQRRATETSLRNIAFSV